MPPVDDDSRIGPMAPLGSNRPRSRGTSRVVHRARPWPSAMRPSAPATSTRSHSATRRTRRSPRRIAVCSARTRPASRAARSTSASRSSSARSSTGDLSARRRCTQGTQRASRRVRARVPARGAVRGGMRAGQEGRAGRDRAPRALPGRLRPDLRPRAPLRARDRAAEREALCCGGLRTGRVSRARASSLGSGTR